MTSTTKKMDEKFTVTCKGYFSIHYIKKIIDKGELDIEYNIDENTFNANLDDLQDIKDNIHIIDFTNSIMLNDFLSRLESIIYGKEEEGYTYDTYGKECPLCGNLHCNSRDIFVKRKENEEESYNHYAREKGLIRKNVCLSCSNKYWSYNPEKELIYLGPSKSGQMRVDGFKKDLNSKCPDKEFIMNYLKDNSNGYGSSDIAYI